MFGQTRGILRADTGVCPYGWVRPFFGDGERDVGRYAQNHSKIDSKSFKQTVVDFRNDFLLILRPQADQGRFSSLFGVLGVFGNIKSRCRCSFVMGRCDISEVAKHHIYGKNYSNYDNFFPIKPTDVRADTGDILRADTGVCPYTWVRPFFG